MIGNSVYDKVSKYHSEIEQQFHGENCIDVFCYNGDFSVENQESDAYKAIDMFSNNRRESSERAMLIESCIKEQSDL